MVDQLPGLSGTFKRGKSPDCCQDGGYGEIDNEALNAQDIAGPSDAAAFFNLRKDAEVLKELLKEKEEIRSF